MLKKKLKEPINHIDLAQNKVNISCHTETLVDTRMELLVHLFFFHYQLYKGKSTSELLCLRILQAKVKKCLKSKCEQVSKIFSSDLVRTAVDKINKVQKEINNVQVTTT